jgi:hypothetical protein
MTEELKQRSTEWRQMRCGVVTASRFADVLTKPRSKEAQYNGEMSETARTYLLEKLSELLTGIPSDRFSTPATKWGTEYEASAFEQALPVISAKFGADMERPEGRNAFLCHATEEYIGCSPDGILGDDGLAEIKCPYNPWNHLRTVLSGAMPDKHTDQVQGSLWVTGRKWYAFCSFDPRLAFSGLDPLFVVRVERDDEYIDRELAPKVIAFRDRLMEEYERLTGGKAPF